MNISDVHLMYEYNYWASGKILAAAAKVTKEQFLAPGEYPFGGLRGTLVHIIDAEYGWRGLFEENKFGDEIKPEEFPDLAFSPNAFTWKKKPCAPISTG
ncbi:MAG: hypothetical protein IPJ47_22720 [Anaerolineales bacterium]|nr:hypothetical protein [Anaerolineales bacterium]